MSDLRPWYRIENAAAPVADVSIYDEISPFGITALDFTADLANVNAPEIALHLNSPGGLVDDGIAIYNALKNHPARIHMFIEGIAASISSVIAMAGDEITIAPHARMMIHNAHMAVMGDADEFEHAAARLRDANANLAGIYSERAGGAPEQWLERMKAESWYTDKEAVAVGLADRVGRSNDKRAAAIAAQQIATFDLSRYRDGERIAARLVAELPHGDILPDDEPGAEVQHGVTCICGEAACAVSFPPSPEATEVQPIGETPVTEDNVLTHREARSRAVDAAIEAAEAALGGRTR